MNINAKYDTELSMDAWITVFVQDWFTVTHSFLEKFIKADILKGLDLKHIPKKFEATIVVKMQVVNSEIIIFNKDLEIPESCFDEQYLNINMIKYAKSNNWILWFNFLIPNTDESLNISFWLTI